MTEPLKGQAIVRQWTEKAEHDLKTAEYTLTMPEDCPYDTICFHAQQCAEKYLKALLISKGVELLKTHDLRVLLQHVPSDASLGLNIKKVLRLNRYTIEARYPGDWEPITREEAEEAVATARDVRQAVRKRLSI